MLKKKRNVIKIKKKKRNNSFPIYILEFSVKILLTPHVSIIFYNLVNVSNILFHSQQIFAHFIDEKIDAVLGERQGYNK